MPDHRRPTRRRKLRLIGPFVIAAALAAVSIGVLAPGWFQKRPAPPPLAPALPTASLAAPPPPPLTRNEIVRRAEFAASAFAAGAPPLTERSPLLGRSFEVRIPFGCGGPTPPDPAVQAWVEFDATSSTVRLLARPADWTSLPMVQSEPSPPDLVEGFWIPRPWMNSEACPPKRDHPAPATPTPPAAQTIGLAQIYRPGDTRVGARRERPYSYAFKLPKDDPARLDHAYRLVLQGRLVEFDHGRTIRCWSESDDHRPICWLAVRFERVAFQDAQTGETLAEWRD